MTSDIPSALSKAAWAVAVAAVLGAGSALVSIQITDARQDETLRQHSDAISKVDRLSDKLDETNRNLAVVNDRLSRMKE